MISGLYNASARFDLSRSTDYTEVSDCVLCVDLEWHHKTNLFGFRDFPQSVTAKHRDSVSDLYSSPNIVRVIKSRRMRWAGHVARMGEERGAYRVLVGKPEGKRPLGRPRRRWMDNIRMDLQEVGCGYVDWIGLAQDRDR